MTTSTDSTVVLHHAPAAQLGAKTPKPTSLTGDVQEALLQIWSSTIVDAQAGVWDASEGSFAAERDGYDEICYITAGQVTVVPENGEPVELTTGDVLVTPCGWRGVWHVHKDVRKVYVIVRKPAIT